MTDKAVITQEEIAPYAACCNDDDLVLYFMREL